MLILFLVTLLDNIIIEQRKRIEESVDVLILQSCFDIQIIELGIDAFTDYIILTTARSQRQVSATLGKLKDYYKLNRIDYNSEGENTSWALISTEDAVVNIFTEESRFFYSLEDLYFDCEITTIDT
jgi:ribosome silencing factor RsfS/YbeB/iojap